MELNKENLIQALSILAKDAKIIIPFKQDETASFVPWDGKTLPYLVGNTTLPPKDMLFPKTEKMYSYNTKNGQIDEASRSENQAVFGIRPCDAESIGNLDKVFLEEGYRDSFYQRKREGLTLISVGCLEPARTCFCDSMGGSPDFALCADVQLNDIGKAYTVEANTPKGEAVLKAWEGILSCETQEKPQSVACPLRVDPPKDLPEKLMQLFNDPIWDEISRACLGCGTCSFVCPTCYCFDIGQESHGNEGAAFRCWDSCMFSDYSRMAGGHNPRPSKKERLRNRYLHKLAYFNERYGQTLCVGCGRCLEKCPANLDISSFIERVKGVDHV